jgi:hypothetical protein
LRTFLNVETLKCLEEMAASEIETPNVCLVSLLALHALPKPLNKESRFRLSETAFFLLLYSAYGQAVSL